MKTLIIVILLLVIITNINAKRTDMYQHVKELRVNSQKFQNNKIILDELFLVKRDVKKDDTRKKISTIKILISTPILVQKKGF